MQTTVIIVTYIKIWDVKFKISRTRLELVEKSFVRLRQCRASG